MAVMTSNDPTLQNSIGPENGPFTKASIIGSTGSNLFAANLVHPERAGIYREIAELVCQDASSLLSMDQLHLRYPPRELPKGAMVTRVGPSPTGMMHMGGLYTALLNRTLAEQSGGVFFLRIEDTDQQRRVEGALESIREALDFYGVSPHEGPARIDGQSAYLDNGKYGPYVQSARSLVYRSVIFEFLSRGLAYPCFMSEAELGAVRARQEAAGVDPGIYGEYALWANATSEAVREKLASGEAFVIRFRPPISDSSELIAYEDAIRGKIEFPKLKNHAVLIKSDGTPTYHFAHLVDDHFMRTTHVIRAEEWIASMPLHLALFEAIGWSPPVYGHIAAIQKIEGASRRKLSKRKDPEANVQYYWEKGIPPEAVLDYLMNLANSSFERWRNNNPQRGVSEFPFLLKDMGTAGPLADLVKLESVSRGALSRMGADRLLALSLAWTKRFDAELHDLMAGDTELTQRALNLERGSEKSANRLITLAGLRHEIGPVFRLFIRPGTAHVIQGGAEVLNAHKGTLRAVADLIPELTSAEQFYPQLQSVVRNFGFASSPKEYKAASHLYRGHIGDVASLLRLALYGRTETPDLGKLVFVLGAKESALRIREFAELLIHAD